MCKVMYIVVCPVSSVRCVQATRHEAGLGGVCHAPHIHPLLCPALQLHPQPGVQPGNYILIFYSGLKYKYVYHTVNRLRSFLSSSHSGHSGHFGHWGHLGHLGNSGHSVHSGHSGNSVIILTYDLDG